VIKAGNQLHFAHDPLGELGTVGVERNPFHSVQAVVKFIAHLVQKESKENTLVRAEPGFAQYVKTHQKSTWFPGSLFPPSGETLGMRFIKSGKRTPISIEGPQRSYVTVHLEMFSLNFSSSSFVIRVNLLYP